LNSISKHTFEETSITPARVPLRDTSNQSIQKPPKTTSNNGSKRNLSRFSEKKRTRKVFTKSTKVRAIREKQRKKEQKSEYGRKKRRRCVYRVGDSENEDENDSDYVPPMHLF
jgi:hypothetical protein